MFYEIIKKYINNIVHIIIICHFVNLKTQNDYDKNINYKLCTTAGNKYLHQAGYENWQK